jgi:transcriptional regulator with XRE-family HTH domain
LLWKKTEDVRDWIHEAAKWCGCDDGRADNLLRGAEPLREELKRISEEVGISSRNLKGKNLVSEGPVGEVLHANLCYLINGLDRGMKSAFAESLGTHATTISGWLSGKSRPAPSNQNAICRYFALPTGTDLERDALFLAYPPVSEILRKRWIRERLDALNAADLQVIFPVIERIFRIR